MFTQRASHIDVNTRRVHTKCINNSHCQQRVFTLWHCVPLPVCSLVTQETGSMGLSMVPNARRTHNAPRLAARAPSGTRLKVANREMARILHCCGDDVSDSPAKPQPPYIWPHQENLTSLLNTTSFCKNTEIHLCFSVPLGQMLAMNKVTAPGPWTANKQTHTHTHTHARTPHTQTHTHTHTLVQFSLPLWRCMWLCTHTHTHTHTHTYTNRDTLPLAPTLDLSRLPWLRGLRGPAQVGLHTTRVKQDLTPVKRSTGSHWVRPASSCPLCPVDWLRGQIQGLRSGPMMFESVH